jgi:hypothetical protein
MQINLFCTKYLTTFELELQSRIGARGEGYDRNSTRNSTSESNFSYNTEVNNLSYNMSLTSVVEYNT